MQYAAFCSIADGLPLATGGDPNAAQVVAMVVKRGPTCGSDYQYCLELFRGIPAAWVMAFEAEWAGRARRYSDGEEGGFPLELIEGYKHMKSVVRNVVQKDVTAVYESRRVSCPRKLWIASKGQTTSGTACLNVEP
jgi:hypothetical protein